MDCRHLDAQISAHPDRIRDRVRNVMQFEIEKNFQALLDQLPNKRRSRGREKLEADLEVGCRRAQLLHQPKGLFRRAGVERHDDLFASRIHALLLCWVLRTESMQVLAPAKVNLSLRVVRRRDDGFHEIETLMVPINLADELVLERGNAGSGIVFECDDRSLPGGDENLVVKAARSFFVTTGIPGDVRIRLTKKIPHGAGLGGGSSDAASTLMGLNQLFQSGLSPEALGSVAATIGSDIPFFLFKSAALCRGRGEIVTPEKSQQPSLHLLLLKPDFGVPTQEAYRNWASSRELPGYDYGPQSFAGSAFFNDLERPVFQKFPFLAEMKEWLGQQPEVGAALMSGSGSTMLAVLEDKGQGNQLAERAKAELDSKLWTCEVRTVSE